MLQDFSPVKMSDLNRPNGDAPLVSIIVTTFNRVNLLAKTLDSILAQSCRDFELIVVDNMSEDGTAAFVASINDTRVLYYGNSNNGVIAINRNYGISRAKGHYVAFCDDDDLWLPDKLKTQIDILTKNPAIALCYSNAESFDNNGTISQQMFRRLVNKNHFFHLLQGNYIPNSSVLILRTVFLELGLLSENTIIREDYDMWLRVSNTYPIIGVNAPLIRYRVHPGNAAGNRAVETLRAIRTLKSVTNVLNTKLHLVMFGLFVQYSKYLIYKSLSLCRVNM